MMKQCMNLLKEPLRMLQVRIPVKMDDGKLKYLLVTVHNIMMQLDQQKVAFVSIRM